MPCIPTSQVVPLARPLPPQEVFVGTEMSVPRRTEAQPLSGPVLILVGEKLRTVALGRRLERAGVRIMRISPTRLASLRAEQLAGVLLPAREIDSALIKTIAARFQISPGWREVPLIIADTCPEALWQEVADLGPFLLPDLVENPVSMASLRRIIAFRMRILAAKEATQRRDAAERSISQRLAEEALLRRESEHRNKNILQIACGILMLEMAENPGPISAGLARAIERIRNLSRIQDLLREAADEQSVRLDVLLPNLVRLITEGTPVQLTVNADVVEAAPERAVSAGLITAEAVMNALKHGRQGRDHMKVCLNVRHTRNDSVAIEIVDDGPGMNMQPSAGVRRFGGIDIMSMLTERLGGKLHIDSPAGASVSVCFPKLV